VTNVHFSFAIVGSSVWTDQFMPLPLQQWFALHWNFPPICKLVFGSYNYSHPESLSFCRFRFYTKTVSCIIVLFLCSDVKYSTYIIMTTQEKLKPRGMQMRESSYCLGLHPVFTGLNSWLVTGFILFSVLIIMYLTWIYRNITVTLQCFCMERFQFVHFNFIFKDC
jgi:hypothetical protein